MSIRTQRRHYETILAKANLYQVRESLEKEIVRTSTKPNTLFEWLRALIYGSYHSDEHLKAKLKLKLFEQKYPHIK